MLGVVDVDTDAGMLVTADGGSEGVMLTGVEDPGCLAGSDVDMETVPGEGRCERTLRGK